MIYLNHDFYSNFSSGSNSDGNNLTIDLFANEISDLIVNDTPKLIDTLNKVGVKVSLDMSDEEIVDKLIDGISKDDKVIKAIGFTIAESNGLINKDKGNKLDWVKSIDAIVLGLTPASKEITKSEETKSVTKQKVMKQIETKSKMKGNYLRTIWKPEETFFSSGSNGLWVVAGVLAVGLCVYFVYKGVKHSQMISSPSITPLING
jgi:hypothetical protein